jgi:hypothetical protein
MKKHASRFNTAAVAATLVTACTNRDAEVQIVSPDAYSSSACWFDRQGHLVAFLVVAKEGEVAVPYTTSARCLVEEGGSSYGEEIILHLNAVPVRDEYGQLQRVMKSVRLGDSTITDQLSPTSNSQVYFLRARAKKIVRPFTTVYAPTEIIDFYRVEPNFERFLGLSKGEREKLLSP